VWRKCLKILGPGCGSDLCLCFILIARHLRDIVFFLAQDAMAEVQKNTKFEQDALGMRSDL